MRITTLAGGVGAARFIRGLVRRIDPDRLAVIVNTGDDEQFYGLHVSPDIDTVIYTLAGAVNRSHGWGLEGDVFNTVGALERFYGRAWFALGDRDLATHLFRTERLSMGMPLSRITHTIAERFGVRARIIPMSDDRVRTFVKVNGRPAMPFQQYFVRGRARGRVERIELRGARRAHASAEAIEAVESSAAVVIAPSNPLVSIGPILATRGMREALRSKRPHVAAISPIVNGRTIKGPADKMMRGLGHEVSALGVARLYRDIASVFVLDKVDGRYVDPIGKLGMRAVVTDTIMNTTARAAALADVVLRALEVYA